MTAFSAGTIATVEPPTQVVLCVIIWEGAGSRWTLRPEPAQRSRRREACCCLLRYVRRDG